MLVGGMLLSLRCRPSLQAALDLKPHLPSPILLFVEHLKEDMNEARAQSYVVSNSNIPQLLPSLHPLTHNLTCSKRKSSTRNFLLF